MYNSSYSAPFLPLSPSLLPAHLRSVLHADGEVHQSVVLVASQHLQQLLLIGGLVGEEEVRLPVHIGLPQQRCTVPMIVSEGTVGSIGRQAGSGCSLTEDEVVDGRLEEGGVVHHL